MEKNPNCFDVFVSLSSNVSKNAACFNLEGFFVTQHGFNSTTGKKKTDPNGWEPDIFGGTVRGRALKDALPEKALVSRSPRGVQPLPEAGREEVWKLLKRLVIFGWNLDGAQTVDIN